MDLDLDNLEIINNTEVERFEVKLGDKLGMIEYRLHGKNIIFTHTEVPQEFEGHGIAGKIAHVALEYAKDSGFRVNPLCPFVANYIRQHPEYQPMTFGY